MIKYDKTKCQNLHFKGYSGCHCSYCESFKSLRGTWVASVKGDYKHYEICVVRQNNRHGLASWGWYGPDKILMGATHHDEQTPKEIFDLLVKTAKKFAINLNKKESK